MEQAPPLDYVAADPILDEDIVTECVKGGSTYQPERKKIITELVVKDNLNHKSSSEASVTLSNVSEPPYHSFPQECVNQKDQHRWLSQSCETSLTPSKAASFLTRTLSSQNESQMKNDLNRECIDQKTPLNDRPFNIKNEDPVTKERNPMNRISRRSLAQVMEPLTCLTSHEGNDQLALASQTDFLLAVSNVKDPVLYKRSTQRDEQLFISQVTNPLRPRSESQKSETMPVILHRSSNRVSENENKTGASFQTNVGSMFQFTSSQKCEMEFGVPSDIFKHLSYIQNKKFKLTSGIEYDVKDQKDSTPEKQVSSLKAYTWSALEQAYSFIQERESEREPESNMISNVDVPYVKDLSVQNHYVKSNSLKDPLVKYLTEKDLSLKKTYVIPPLVNGSLISNQNENHVTSVFLEVGKTSDIRSSPYHKYDQTADNAQTRTDVCSSHPSHYKDISEPSSPEDLSRDTSHHNGDNSNNIFRTVDTIRSSRNLAHRSSPKDVFHNWSPQNEDKLKKTSGAIDPVCPIRKQTCREVVDSKDGSMLSLTEGHQKSKTSPYLITGNFIQVEERRDIPENDADVITELNETSPAEGMVSASGKQHSKQFSSSVNTTSTLANEESKSESSPFQNTSSSAHSSVRKLLKPKSRSQSVSQSDKSFPMLRSDLRSSTTTDLMESNNGNANVLIAMSRSSSPLDLSLKPRSSDGNIYRPRSNLPPCVPRSRSSENIFRFGSMVRSSDISHLQAAIRSPGETLSSTNGWDSKWSCWKDSLDLSAAKINRALSEDSDQSSYPDIQSDMTASSYSECSESMESEDDKMCSPDINGHVHPNKRKAEDDSLEPQHAAHSINKYWKYYHSCVPEKFMLDKNNLNSMHTQCVTTEKSTERENEPCTSDSSSQMPVLNTATSCNHSYELDCKRCNKIGIKPLYCKQNCGKETDIDLENAYQNEQTYVSNISDASDTSLSLYCNESDRPNIYSSQSMPHHGKEQIHSPVFKTDSQSKTKYDQETKTTYGPLTEVEGSPQTKCEDVLKTNHDYGPQNETCQTKPEYATHTKTDYISDSVFFSSDGSDIVICSDCECDELLDCESSQALQKSDTHRGIAANDSVFLHNSQSADHASSLDDSVFLPNSENRTPDMHLSPKHDVARNSFPRRRSRINTSYSLANLNDEEARQVLNEQFRMAAELNHLRYGFHLKQDSNSSSSSSGSECDNHVCNTYLVPASPGIRLNPCLPSQHECIPQNPNDVHDIMISSSNGGQPDNWHGDTDYSYDTLNADAARKIKTSNTRHHPHSPNVSQVNSQNTDECTPLIQQTSDRMLDPNNDIDRSKPDVDCNKPDVDGKNQENAVDLCSTMESEDRDYEAENMVENVESDSQDNVDDSQAESFARTPPELPSTLYQKHHLCSTLNSPSVMPEYQCGLSAQMSRTRHVPVLNYVSLEGVSLTNISDITNSSDVIVCEKSCTSKANDLSTISCRYASSSSFTSEPDVSHSKTEHTHAKAEASHSDSEVNHKPEVSGDEFSQFEPCSSYDKNMSSVFLSDQSRHRGSNETDNQSRYVCNNDTYTIHNNDIPSADKVSERTGDDFTRNPDLLKKADGVSFSPRSPSLVNILQKLHPECLQSYSHSPKGIVHHEHSSQPASHEIQVHTDPGSNVLVSEDHSKPRTSCKREFSKTEFDISGDVPNSHKTHEGIHYKACCERENDTIYSLGYPDGVSKYKTSHACVYAKTEGGQIYQDVFHYSAISPPQSPAHVELPSTTHTENNDNSDKSPDIEQVSTCVKTCERMSSKIKHPLIPTEKCNDLSDSLAKTGTKHNDSDSDSDKSCSDTEYVCNTSHPERSFPLSEDSFLDTTAERRLWYGDRLLEDISSSENSHAKELRVQFHVNSYLYNILGSENSFSVPSSKGDNCEANGGCVLDMAEPNDTDTSERYTETKKLLSLKDIALMISNEPFERSDNRCFIRTDDDGHNYENQEKGLEKDISDTGSPENYVLQTWGSDGDKDSNGETQLGLSNFHRTSASLGEHLITHTNATTININTLSPSVISVNGECNSSKSTDALDSHTATSDKVSDAQIPSVFSKQSSNHWSPSRTLRNSININSVNTSDNSSVGNPSDAHSQFSLNTSASKILDINNPCSISNEYSDRVSPMPVRKTPNGHIEFSVSDIHSESVPDRPSNEPKCLFAYNLDVPSESISATPATKTNCPSICSVPESHSKSAYVNPGTKPITLPVLSISDTHTDGISATPATKLPSSQSECCNTSEAWSPNNSLHKHTPNTTLNCSEDTFSQSLEWDDSCEPTYRPFFGAHNLNIYKPSPHKQYMHKPPFLHFQGDPLIQEINVGGQGGENVVNNPGLGPDNEDEPAANHPAAGAGGGGNGGFWRPPGLLLGRGWQRFIIWLCVFICIVVCMMAVSADLPYRFEGYILYTFFCLILKLILTAMFDVAQE